MANGNSNDPGREAARHSLEGWRSFVGGLLAVGIGCYDVWFLGPNKGLSVEIDELLIFVGVGLMVSIPNILTQYLAGAVQKVTPKEQNAQIPGTKTEEGISKQP